VTAVRSGRWWVLESSEIGLTTQVHKLETAERAVREAASLLGVEVESVDIAVTAPLDRALQEADEIFAADQSGVDPPPIDPATVAMPIFADSRVVPLRLSRTVHEKLTAIAEKRGVAVTDVIRAAILRHVGSPPE
jgi:hypothetical protein